MRTYVPACRTTGGCFERRSENSQSGNRGINDFNSTPSEDGTDSNSVTETNHTPPKRQRKSDANTRKPSHMDKYLNNPQPSTSTGKSSPWDAGLALAREKMDKSLNRLLANYEKNLQQNLKRKEVEWAKEKKVLEKKISDEIAEKEELEKKLLEKDAAIKGFKQKLSDAKRILG